MAAFEYQALDTAGATKTGVIAAETAKAARKELRRQKLTPVKLKETRARAAKGEKKGLSLGKKAKSADVVLATRQLAILVKASTPVEEALQAVAMNAQNPRMREALMAVRGRVTEGRRLGDAMASEPDVFSPLFRAMVSAGEGSGSLGVVLERLADYMEASRKLRGKIMGAVAYPAALAVVALLVVAALLVFVVPKIVAQFETLGQDLPPLTNAVIAISAFLRGPGLIVVPAAVVGAIVFGRIAFATPPLRRSVETLLMRLPVFGKLSRGVNAARFARTMATLLASGTPAMEALSAAKRTMGSLVMREAVDSIVTKVSEGASVSAAMRQTKVFPPLLVHLAASGEKAGALGEMFDKGAEYLEAEFDQTTGVALNLLEPLIIVIMGGAVATIVLAIMLPILQLNTATLL